MTNPRHYKMQRVTICDIMPPPTTTPQEKIAAAMAALFRSISASRDRELAGVAIALEPKVLDLVKRSGRSPRAGRAG